MIFRIDGYFLCSFEICLCTCAALNYGQLLLKNDLSDSFPAHIIYSAGCRCALHHAMLVSTWLLTCRANSVLASCLGVVSAGYQLYMIVAFRTIISRYI